MGFLALLRSKAAFLQARLPLTRRGVIGVISTPDAKLEAALVANQTVHGITEQPTEIKAARLLHSFDSLHLKCTDLGLLITVTPRY